MQHVISSFAFMSTACQKNIKKKLIEGLRMNEEESKQIFEDFFGSSFQTGLTEIDQPRIVQISCFKMPFHQHDLLIHQMESFVVTPANRRSN